MIARASRDTDHKPNTASRKTIDAWVASTKSLNSVWSRKSSASASIFSSSQAANEIDPSGNPARSSVKNLHHHLYACFSSCTGEYPLSHESCVYISDLTRIFAFHLEKFLLGPAVAIPVTATNLEVPDECTKVSALGLHSFGAGVVNQRCCVCTVARRQHESDKFNYFQTYGWTESKAQEQHAQGFPFQGKAQSTIRPTNEQKLEPGVPAAPSSLTIS